MEVKKERFYNVDFFRFVLILVIMFYHFGLSLKNIDPFFAKIHSHFCHGFICVEFFFIISGFFLFKNINRDEDTITFIKKKLIRLLPVKYFALIGCCIASIFSKKIILFNQIIIPLLLLNNIGFDKMPMVSPEFWYISVLFWISLFYFYINKLLNKKWLNVFLWLIVVFSCSIILNCNYPDYARLFENNYLIINQGVVRGLFGIGLGYFIAMLYKSNFMKDSTRLNKLFISAIEIYSLSFLVYYLAISSKVPGNNYLNYIIIFSLLFYLMLIKQGLISKLLDNKILAKLGQYTYSLYVIHCLIFRIYKPFCLKFSPEVYVILCISTAITSGILTFYFIEKPAAKYLKEKFLNIQKPINNQVLPK